MEILWTSSISRSILNDCVYVVAAGSCTLYLYTFVFVLFCLQEQDGNVFDGDIGFDAYPF